MLGSELLLLFSIVTFFILIAIVLSIILAFVFKNIIKVKDQVIVKHVFFGVVFFAEILIFSILHWSQDFGYYYTTAISLLMLFLKYILPQIVFISIYVFFLKNRIKCSKSFSVFKYVFCIIVLILQFIILSVFGHSGMMSSRAKTVSEFQNIQ